MRKHLVKDKYLRISFSKAEKRRLIWKSIYKNQFMPHRTRNMCQFLLYIDKNYFVRIRNYCTISGRSRGVVYPFGISRMFFKEYASFGFLQGIKKSSW